MVSIIPAILPKTAEELRGNLLQVKGSVQDVQIDIVDGLYAPNKTWPYIGSSERRAASGEEQIAPLPFAGDFDFEIDLMAAEPEEAAEMWRQAGAARIVIHADAPGAREALMALRFEREEKNAPVVSVGIALPCSATPDILKEYENLYDYVQVMGIEKVGFQGQPFDRRAIELVRQLHEQYPSLPIQVDGGVSEETIPELIRAGATRLVVGSQIWKSDDPTTEVARLQSLVGKLQS